MKGFLTTFFIFVWLDSGTCSSGPNFIREPPLWVTFTNSTGALVECSASGVPTPLIEWIGLDHNVIGNIPGFREVWSNGTLSIFPFSGTQYRQDAHSGVFQCRARNPSGTILAPPTTLRAVVVQELEVRLYDEYVLAGNTAILKCIVPSFMNDLVTVSAWTKDESFHIYPTTEGEGKHHALPDGRLLIFDVENSDTYAQYRCRATHRITLASALSNTAKVIVKNPTDRQPPKIVTKTEVVKALPDTAVVIPCIAHAYPHAKYRWMLIRKGNLREPLHISGSRRSFGSGLNGNYGGGGGGGGGEVLILAPEHETLRHVSHGLKVVCEAYNEAGSATMEVTIERFEPISIDLSPKVLTLDATTNGQFTCRIPRSIEHLSITWYKNGQLITSNGAAMIKESGSVLEIQRAGRHDAGMYQCFVKLQERLYQATAELRLGASPPEFQYQFIQQTLTPGPAVSLKCISGGSPTPTIAWALDGFPLPQSDRILMGQYVSMSGEVVSHVNISRTRVEDGGEYSCTAKNVAGTVTHSAPLYIYGPPFVRDLETLTAVAGEPFNVRCPVAGYPVPSVTWTKSGRELPLSRRHGVTGPELQIFKVNRETDEGKYVCTASDRQGRTSSKALHLKVVEPPKVEPFTLPQALTAGSRVAVQCVVVQGDPPIGLQWFHNHHLAHKTAGITVTPLGLFVLAIVIDQLAPIHAGNYTCKATSHATGSSDSHSVYLRVNVAPHWKVEPRDVSVIKGGDALLNCVAEGFPTPTVTWRRTPKGNKQNLYHHTFNQNLNGAPTLTNGSLLLKNVNEESEGSYHCEVSNGVGMDLSALAQVNVQVPPSVQGKERIEIRKGDSVTLRCIATGDVPLTLSIARNGQPIDASDARFTFKILDNRPENSNKVFEAETSSAKESELRIASVTSDDSGDFTCTATNPFGSHTHITQLIVQDVPEAPRNLRLANEGSRFAAVSWTPPVSPNTPILHYMIYIKLQEESWSSPKFQPVKIEGNAFSAEIKDLQPASSYQIRIAAVNSVGESPTSEALAIQTKGEPPSSPPQNVRAIPLSPKRVKVEWSPPDSKAWHGRLMGYYIGYRKDSPDKAEDYVFQKMKPGNGNEYSTVIEHLQKFTRYEFVVQAFNELGPGPLSREVHAATHEDVPEAPPRDFTCLSLTSKRLEVSWSPPPEELTHGKIISYSVIYNSLDKYSMSSPQETRVLSGKNTILSDLMPFTNYSIIIAASTAAGKGEESKPITCFTEEDIPDAPEAIKGLVAGFNEVIVAWSTPTRTNGLLTKFTLYTQSTRHHDIKRRMIPPQSRNYIISNMVEGEEILMWLTASTRVGEGLPTRKVSVTPSSKVPAGIKAVDEVLRVARGSDVLLSCPYIGVPNPELQWKKDETQLDLLRWKRQPDGGLLLHESKREDSGNYSCHVNNLHGSDSVTYSFLVMVAPGEPRLRSLGSTSNSVTVTWTLGSDGGAAIDKLTLTWRPDREEWKETTLQRYAATYTLQNLNCGTSYHLYLTAHNEIGPGSASEVVSVRTKGGRPTTPPQHRVISVNSSTVTLNLVPFNDTDCPVNNFYVRVKPSSSTQWNTASDNLPGTRHEYSMKDLRSGTEYEMEVTATNSAGKTLTRYSFRTLPMLGDMKDDPQSSIIIRDQQWIRNNDNLLSDPAFIVPVILSCIAFIAILTSAVICIRRKSTSIPSKPPQTKIHEIKHCNRLEDYANDSQYYPTIKKVPSPPPRDVESIDTAPEYPEDIYPYATFQLQQQTDGSTLQTLVFQDPRKTSAHTVAYRKDNNDRKGGGGHGRSLSSGSEYARIRKHRRRGPNNYGGGVESEESISDTDTDFASSTRTESSSRIDGRNAHHNMLYLTSDASTIPSPPSERKSLPQCKNNIRANFDEGGSDRIYGISAIRDSSRLPISHLNHQGHKSPANPNSRKRKGSSDGLVEYSETECDRDSRRRTPISIYNSFAV